MNVLASLEHNLASHITSLILPLSFFVPSAFFLLHSIFSFCLLHIPFTFFSLYISFLILPSFLPSLLPSFSQEEAEYWVPRKAARAGLQFLSKKIPHVPPRVINEFLRSINKVNLQSFIINNLWITISLHHYTSIK